tara:strand:+ start:252 stop:473 length:222 start_codon:yes stop_codon:yes gene_type:complete
MELSEDIDSLFDDGYLDKMEHAKALGVAQQVIHQGFESLSPKQKALYEAVVEPALKKQGEQRRINEMITSNPD